MTATYTGEKTPQHCKNKCKNPSHCRKASFYSLKCKLQVPKYLHSLMKGKNTNDIKYKQNIILQKCDIYLQPKRCICTDSQHFAANMTSVVTCFSKAPLET